MPCDDAEPLRHVGQFVNNVKRWIRVWAAEAGAAGGGLGVYVHRKGVPEMRWERVCQPFQRRPLQTKCKRKQAQ